MYRLRNRAIATVFLLFICHLSAFPRNGPARGIEQASPPSPKPQEHDQSKLGADDKTKEIELIQLRLEKALTEQLQRDQKELGSRLQGEIKDHRDYLQRLDDKFYERFTYWVPLFTAALIAVSSIFVWFFGKTRNEAIESACKETAVRATDQATELAQKKVDEIVNPSAMTAKLETAMEDALDQIRRAADQSVADAEREVKAVKDQIRRVADQSVADAEREVKAVKEKIVANSSEVIIQALDESIRDKFKKELDLLQRVEKLEDQVSSLTSSLENQVSNLTSSLEELRRLLSTINPSPIQGRRIGVQRSQSASDLGLNIAGYKGP